MKAPMNIEFSILFSEFTYIIRHNGIEYYDTIKKFKYVIE